MASVFTRIIVGELPARFVWKDEHCVAFLTINPIRPGHVLVVTREEIAHWIDLPAGLARHLMDVSQAIARALQSAWQPARVGLMIAGLEVPHVHLHVLPIDDLGDLSFANADPDPAPEALDEAAGRIREALRAAGCPQACD
jgi:histidine triad (HIT) family protein